MKRMSDKMAAELVMRVVKDLDPEHELDLDEIGILVQAIKDGRKVVVDRTGGGKPRVTVSI